MSHCYLIPKSLYDVPEKCRKTGIKKLSVTMVSSTSSRQKKEDENGKQLKVYVTSIIFSKVVIYMLLHV